MDLAQLVSWLYAKSRIPHQNQRSTKYSFLINQYNKLHYHMITAKQSIGYDRCVFSLWLQSKKSFEEPI